MSVHLERSITGLKRKILILGARVEETVRLAAKSVTARDETLARQVIEQDDEIDQLEVDVEEEGLKMLALYQPVAIDLRFIVATLKINNDLERIGDVAVNIAERAVFLANRKALHLAVDFAEMAGKTQQMLKRSLDSLVNMDVDLARAVCAADDEVDAMNRAVYEELHHGLRHRLEDMEVLIHVLGVSRHLERIADLATNIAEDVIYMASGQIVRHRTEDYLGREQAGTQD